MTDLWEKAFNQGRNRIFSLRRGGDLFHYLYESLVLISGISINGFFFEVIDSFFYFAQTF
nr:Uncharacterized protein A9P81_1907 [Leptospira interrogans serovar Copenhageni/Icterohaemorrhagiae]